MTFLALNYFFVVYISDTAESVNWIMTYFYDRDSDETSDYNGYTFTFENSGTLTATNGTNTYTGLWSVTNSNSNDDSSNDIDFNIIEWYRIESNCFA